MLLSPLASSVTIDDLTIPEECILDEPNKCDEVPKAGTIGRMLPPDSFKVDTPTSLMYFAVDVAAVILSMGFLDAVVTSDNYRALPMFAQALAVAPLQVLTGFAMWCTWCIGHDAGHGTVSKNARYGGAINRVVGEVTHSMLCLTPFVPRRLSHRKHHLNHNHLEKVRSVYCT